MVQTTLEHVIDIDASPATVYRMWTTAEGLATWWGAAPTVEAWVGGTIRVAVDDEHVMAGAYTRLDEPGVVAFTFGWEGGEPPPGSSEVEVKIDERPEGGCRMVLRHGGLPLEAIGSHAAGWTHFAGGVLAEVAGGSGTDG
jgi:uncharacterized protein YndB with AHSA1/START domain